MFTTRGLPAAGVIRTPGLQETRLYTSIPFIDSFLGGIPGSSLLLMDSSDRFLFDLTHRVAIDAVRHGEVVWVDGGNSVNPHAMAGLCKRLGMDTGEVLDSVNIARAFTAYQMVSLIEDHLEKEVEDTECSALIVSCFPDLFHDRDMWWSEAFQLIKRCVSLLRGITQRHGTGTLITNHGLTKISCKRSMHTFMYDSADSVLRMENRSKALMLSLVKEGRSMLYRPVPYYQTTLDEFG